MSNNPKSMESLKREHLQEVFSIIYQKEKVSRAELSKLTKLTRPTISTLVNQLIETGVVIETGARVTNVRGRNPIVLEINPDGGYIVIVILDGKKMSVVLSNLGCEIVCEYDLHIQEMKTVDSLIIQTIESAIQEKGIEINDVLGISICSPGIILSKSYSVLSSISTRDVNPQKTSFKAVTQHYKNIPVAINHKGAFSAYAEKCKWDTIPKCAVYMILEESKNFGGVILIDGELYEGGGNAGEIGHMSININGEQCYCGNRGCIEKYVEVPVILQRVQEEIDRGTATSITEIAQRAGEELNIHHVAQAYAEGDPLARVVMHEIARIMARGIDSYINVFCPELIILGGVMPMFGDHFLQAIISQLQNRWYLNGNVSTEIRFRKGEQEEVAVGAARFFIDKLLDIPNYLKRKQGFRKKVGSMSAE